MKSISLFMALFCATSLYAQCAPSTQLTLLNTGAVQTRRDISITIDGQTVRNIPIINGWSPDVRYTVLQDGTAKIDCDYSARRQWRGETQWGNWTAQEQKQSYVLHIQQDGNLHGFLEDVNNQKVPFILVILKQKGRVVASSVANAQGDYVMSGVQEGDYEMWSGMDTTALARHNVRVQKRQQVSVPHPFVEAPSRLVEPLPEIGSPLLRRPSQIPTAQFAPNYQ